MGIQIFTISVVWYLNSPNAGGRERFESIRELFFDERAAAIRLEQLNEQSDSVEYVLGEMTTRDEPNPPEPLTSYGKPSSKTYVRGWGNYAGTQAAWLNRTTKTRLILSFNGVLGEFSFCRYTGKWIDSKTGGQIDQNGGRQIPPEELDRLNEGFAGVIRKI